MKRKTRKPLKGFISAPTLSQLKPTPKEIAKMEELIEWQKRSEKSTIILGVPLESQ